MVKHNFSISIIIPSYNNAHLIKKNLPRLIQVIKQSNYQMVKEIIITDDGSKDNFKLQMSNIKIDTNISLRILENKENKGFSTNVNRGVNKASGDIVLLLNTDVYPEGDFITPALKHFQNEKIFAIGLLDKSIEGTTVVKRGSGYGFWEKGFVQHGQGDVSGGNTFWVSGGSGMFRRSVWKKLGGMDEIFNPFYWEDIDLSYRARKAGFNIVFEPKSIVVHEHEKGTIKSSYSENKIKMTSYRNQIIFVWKNITDRALLFSHVIWLPRHLFTAVISGNWTFLLAFSSALVSLPSVLSKRSKQKKYYLLPDSRLIASVTDSK